jgi:hypothetical protein
VNDEVLEQTCQSNFRHIGLFPVFSDARTLLGPLPVMLRRE